MLGSILGSLLFESTASAEERARRRLQEMRNERNAALLDQEAALAFMDRHHCHIVIIKPDGMMVPG